MDKREVYLVAAAGTGGHVFPAMAVAQQLREKAAVKWLGTEKGMEGDLARKQGFLFYVIPMKGFRGKSVLQKLLMPVNLLMSVFQAMKVISSNKVTVVVGFGGYVTLPCGLAAKLLGRKLVLHEQNSVAGSANKLLAKIADKVLVAYPGVLPDCEHVGNPVRQSIVNLHQKSFEHNKRDTRVLIMGGSLGAEAINLVLPECLQKLAKNYSLSVWHQTGKGKLEKTQALYEEKNIDDVLHQQARLDEFLDSVEEAYEWADLVICRAGALTVSELTIAGLPAIFIPYPWAIDNHQYSNAKWLVDNSAAAVIEQKNMTATTLAEAVENFLGDEKLLETYSNNMKQLAQINATQRVVDACVQFTRGSNHAA